MQEFNLNLFVDSEGFVKAKKIEPVPPVVVKFVVLPESLKFGGGSAQLSWSVSNCDTVTIEGVPGTFGPAGDVTVSATFGTNYVLKGTGPGGTVYAEAYLDVLPKAPPIAPPVGTFTVSATKLPIGGGAVTLSWTSEPGVDFATEASYAEISPAVGTVNPAGGSVTITVDKTVSWTLTLENDVGSTTYSVGVEVEVPEVIDAHIVDWREIGSGGLASEFKLPSYLVAKGWWEWLFTPEKAGQKSFCDTVINFGADEVVFHRIFGQPLTISNMDFSAYTEAKKVSTLFRVTNVNMFVAAFVEFYKRWRKPITFYYGYPNGAVAPWLGLSPAAAKQLIVDNLFPLVTLRNALIQAGAPADTVRLAIDAWASKNPADTPNYWLFTLAYETAIEKGISMVAGEPWPSKNFPQLSNDLVRYFVAEEGLKSWSPEETATSASWAATYAAITGGDATKVKVIPYCTGHGGPYTPEQDRARVKARGRKFRAIGWQGWSTTLFPNAQAIQDCINS